MSKRRATAHDRDIVDWLRNMKPGIWKIEVEDPTAVGFGNAEIKREGSIKLDFGKTVVRIWPEIRR